VSSLAHEQLDVFCSCAVFKNLSSIGRCQVKRNGLALKVGPPSDGHQKHNYDFD
jgi:hypothetical protein